MRNEVRGDRDDSWGGGRPWREGYRGMGGMWQPGGGWMGYGPRWRGGWGYPRGGYWRRRRGFMVPFPGGCCCFGTFLILGFVPLGSLITALALRSAEHTLRIDRKKKLSVKW